MVFIQSKTKSPGHLAVACLLICTAAAGVLFITGLLQVVDTFPANSVNVLAARETSVAIRPDFPVSTFVYERASFKWFIGLAKQASLSAISIFALTAACIAITSGLGAGGCAAAAVGVVATAFGVFQAAKAGSGGVGLEDIELGAMPQVNGFGGPGSFPATRVGRRSFEDEDESSQRLLMLLRHVFGPDYKIEGLLDSTEPRHRDLVAIAEGRPIGVASFTSAAGIRFHHTMIHDRRRGGMFHRFGFAPPESATAVGKRYTDIEKSNEYFSKGGLDGYDCDTGTSDVLTAADATTMTSLLECNDPTLLNNTQISIQVYDATSMGTIGAGVIAPFTSNDPQSSSVSNDSGTGDCPVALEPQNGCSTMETQN